MSFSIQPPMTSIGPVRVRMTGVVSGTEKGPGVGIVNAPTAADATAELNRVARVSGADRVVSVASDYRRAALAGGTTSTQWRIDVQAWGTAMAPASVEPAESEEAQEADKARRAKDDPKSEVKATQENAADTEAPTEQAPAEPEPAPVAELPAAPAPVAVEPAAPSTPAPTPSPPSDG